MAHTVGRAGDTVVVRTYIRVSLTANATPTQVAAFIPTIYTTAPPTE